MPQHERVPASLLRRGDVVVHAGTISSITREGRRVTIRFSTSSGVERAKPLVCSETTMFLRQLRSRTNRCSVAVTSWCTPGRSAASPAKDDA